MSTPTPVICPQCDRPIPSDAPQHLCPHCALAGAATAPASGRPLTPAANLPSLDRVAAAFPNLEIIELLGAGGMGVVFKARQPRLDRHVALKLLPESLAQDPAFAERFHREARMLARLNHPNIVAVYDFGEAGGFYYLLMEYVDGVNLRQAMQAGRFSPAEALRTVPGICEALQFAHDEGILHRDVKPENILLDARGRVKIADFGIAKLIGGPSPDITLTGSGAAVGTPQYMAPEQIERPRDVDHRADIYSLGVVFYEMLTGELPLGRFAPPSEKSAVGPQIDAVVLRTLEKERERRYQSATEVRTRVEELARAPVGAATPPARHPGAPAAAAPLATQSPGPDFILCDPRLPRLARALSVYIFLVAPVVWLLSLMTHQPETHPSPYANFIANNANDLLILAETAGLALLVTGGVLLRGLRPSAVTLLPLALLLRLSLLPLSFAAVAWVDRLNTTWIERSNRTPLPETSLTGGEVVLTVLALASMIFELVACVWLLRRRRDLATLLAVHRRTERTQPVADSSGPAAHGTSASAPHATAAAVLTGLSLALGLAGLGGLAMYGVMHRTHTGSGGLGPFEVAILLLFPASIIVGLGLVGLGLGSRAARAQRHAHGTLGGTRRIVLGAFGWPLVLVVATAGAASGWAFFQVSDSTFLTLLLTLTFTLGSAEFALRSVWRWLNRIPRSQRCGRAPAWIHGFAGLTVIALAISAAPAGLLAYRSQQIDRIRPMAMVLSPDPAIPPGESGGRAAMQLAVTCPPRSIVWLRTGLSREGRLLRSPVSEDHVVNGGLDWQNVPLLLRTVEAGTETDPQWDLVVRAESGSAQFEFRSPESAGVRWAPVGLTEQVLVNLTETQSIEVLRGRGPAGDEWTVTLLVSFDPLPPAITFDGVAAASGRDWPATAGQEEPRKPTE